VETENEARMTYETKDHKDTEEEEQLQAAEKDMEADEVCMLWDPCQS
jgi:hypothetical protein